MKKVFHISSWAAIALIAIGIFRFDNFRDSLYLLIMLVLYVGIVSGVHVIIKKLENN